MSLGNLSEYKVKSSTIPSGTYDGRVLAFIDLGKHYQMFGDKRAKSKKTGEDLPPATLVRIVIEVVDKDGVYHTLKYKDVRLSFYPQSNFIMFLATVLNISADDVPDFIVKAEKETGNGVTPALGVPVTVQVKERESNKKRMYNTITSVTRLDERLEAPKPNEVPFVFATGSDDAAQIFTERLSKYTKLMVMQALDVNNFPAALQQAMAEYDEELTNTPTVSSSNTSAVDSDEEDNDNIGNVLG